MIDARTFETEDIIRIPSAVGREASCPTSPHPLLASPTPSDVTATPPVRQVSQLPRVIRTSEESFRASPFSNGGPLTSRRPPHRMQRRRDGEDVEDYSYGNVPGLPHLGDNTVQENIREAFSRRAVRTYLAHRGDIYPHAVIRGAASPYGNNEVDGDGREDVDGMDVDEPEADCISRAPSRSSSPPPSAHLALHTSPSPSRNTALARYTRLSPHVGRRPRVNFMADQLPNPDLDIAGTCFDPHGGMVYVATTDSISEWAVRGADKRWWGYSTWV